MFKLDDCVYYMATLGLKKVTDTYNKTFIKYGATRVQWIALYYIKKSQGIRQMDLADMMESQETTIARLINRMEKNRLIEKQHDPQDGRAVKLYCTDQGNELFKELLPVCKNFFKNITTDISKEDLDTFKNVLDKLVENSMNHLI
ncbi:MAG: hypothetical protein B6241_01795 [Spirochaetaceae bacterium 4572_59]|nr:MAG: hypothetical protein B6241_01795 [Spirochaetaceae bacterium 4572_59]